MIAALVKLVLWIVGAFYLQRGIRNMLGSLGLTKVFGSQNRTSRGNGSEDATIIEICTSCGEVLTIKHVCAESTTKPTQRSYL